ncbi:MAG: hypothetical protein ACLQT6_02495 [Desulfomonilaceae bacterium]
MIRQSGSRFPAFAKPASTYALKLRQNWTLVQQYSHELDMVVGGLAIAALGAWAVATHLRRKRVVEEKTD